MNTIWCAISGHGFGHAAQVVPVLNELGPRVPGLRVILRTAVPAPFFKDRLTVPWELQPVQQDVGCIQHGPLEIDVAATWEALASFHADWTSRLTEEKRALTASKPRVILADTPYLAIQAGYDTGIPAVAMANFTWSEALLPFIEQDRPAHRSLVNTIEQAYSHATLALRCMPGLPMPAFSTVADIGPIAQPARSRRRELRAVLKAAESDCVVLIGFGGIPLVSLPWEEMNAMTGYHFIVDGIPADATDWIHPLAMLPYSFKELLASVDLILTKPGYGTIVESVALRQPVVYVRRYNFADEAPLVSFLHQYGRGRELSVKDFQNGNWLTAFQAVRQLPIPNAPPSYTGAADAARHLAAYF